MRDWRIERTPLPRRVVAYWIDSGGALNVGCDDGTVWGLSSDGTTWMPWVRDTIPQGDDALRTPESEK